MGNVVDAFLFQPPSPPTPIRLRPASNCSDMELVWLNTSEGSTIPGLYLHRKYARYTILYSHGNAEDLGMLGSYLSDLSKILHVNVFAYDYTGYGFSNRDSTSHRGSSVSIPPPIPPSEQHFYADITAAYDYLVKIRGVEPRNIILYGRSIGSGPSCYLASKLNKKASRSVERSASGTLLSCPPNSAGCSYDDDRIGSETDGDVSRKHGSSEDYIAGLVLHSPFASVYRVVLDLGFTFQQDQFPNIERIGDVCCPVLVIHGTQDEIVPFKHGQMLYDLVPKRHKVFKPFWARDMGHNNIEVDATNAFVRYLMEFLQLIRQRQRTGYHDISGPSLSHNPNELTRAYVQTHVMLMMDKESQSSRFLKRSTSESTNKLVPVLEHEEAEVSTKLTLSHPNNYAADGSGKQRSRRKLPRMPESQPPMQEERFSETAAERA